jgi:hypothetical protein
MGGTDEGDRTPKGFRPTDFLTTSTFAALSFERQVRGLDYPFALGFDTRRRCPSSLYTFPFLGLARDCHLKGFPEFEQFYIFGFPKSTQFTKKKSVAFTNFATPAQG